MGLQKDAQIADIGSGTGLFAEPLLEKGYRVTCIEPNEQMRKAGQSRLGQYPYLSVAETKWKPLVLAMKASI